MKNDQNKLMYQCKIFSVYAEKVPLPDGRSVKQSWIDHKPTVAVVAVNNENKVLLIKQYRAAVKNHLLEIPAGTMDREGDHLLSVPRESWLKKPVLKQEL